MAISFYKLRLRSNNIAQSVSFYNFLFDTDAEEDDDGESFILIDQTRLYFDESIKKPLSQAHFTMGIADPSDFINFKNKVILAFYKDSLTPHIIKDTQSVFSFKDMDDNPWAFELM